MTEFITRNYGSKEFEVIIKTDSRDHYLSAQDFARKLIDHAKPQTNADRIRAMSDEELAHELAMVAGWEREQYKKAKSIGIEKVMMDWLQQPAEVDNG